jgi:hypothetical protein
MSQIPTIVIDGIKFELIMRAKKNEKYNIIVLVRSTDIYGKKRKFWTYRSSSELGMWRLCIFKLETTKYDKGTQDYVQATLIHLGLQDLLNQYAPSLSYVEIYQNNNVSKLCFCANASKNGCGMDEAKLEIDDIDRVISEPPFKDLDDIKHEIVGCGVIPNGTHNDVVAEVLNDFSDEFETEFEIDFSTLTLLLSYNFNFENVINGNASIYSITLRRKQGYHSFSSNEVVLFFTKAILQTLRPYALFNFNQMQRNVTRICKQDFHIFPFLLSTPTATVTPFGLYSEYIPCGVFICKLFDYYATQCTITEQQQQRCSKRYSYIGHRYSEVFPIRNIIQSFKETCILERDSSTLEDGSSTAKRHMWNGPLISRFRNWKETRKANRTQRELQKQQDDITLKEERRKQEDELKQIQESQSKFEEDYQKKLEQDANWYLEGGKKKRRKNKTKKVRKHRRIKR